MNRTSEYVVLPILPALSCSTTLWMHSPSRRGWAASAGSGCEELPLPNSSMDNVA